MKHLYEEHVARDLRAMVKETASKIFQHDPLDLDSQVDELILTFSHWVQDVAHEYRMKGDLIRQGAIASLSEKITEKLND